MQRQKSQHSDPWAALDAEIRKPVNRIPTGDGWRTKEECARAWGCGHSKADREIFRLKRAGRIEMFNGLLDGARRVWYRIKV